jgi:hypothetical protein
MFYYKFTATTPYCGTEDVRYYEFETEPSAGMLDDMASELKYENGERFEYLVTGWDDSNIEDLTEEDIEMLLENYYDDCECAYEQITKEEYEENT